MKLQRTSWIGAATVATFAFQSAVHAQASFASAGDVADLTYAKDVAAIIQQNC